MLHRIPMRQVIQHKPGEWLWLNMHKEGNSRKDQSASKPEVISRTCCLWIFRKVFRNQLGQGDPFPKISFSLSSQPLPEPIRDLKLQNQSLQHITVSEMSEINVLLRRWTQFCRYENTYISLQFTYLTHVRVGATIGFYTTPKFSPWSKFCYHLYQLKRHVQILPNFMVPVSQKIWRWEELWLTLGNLLSLKYLYQHWCSLERDEDCLFVPVEHKKRSVRLFSIKGANGPAL